MKKALTLFFFYLLSLTSAHAHPGNGIVMDKEGNVFYTDLVHVWKITPTGEHTIAVKDVHTHELYMDEAGNLYGEHVWYEGEATDKWGSYVWCLGRDGTLEKTIPDVEGFLDNNTLVRDPVGNSYWVDRSGEFEQIVKHSPQGTNTIFTDHRFKDVRWMYFSNSDNNLYVVDLLEIKKVSPTGAVEIVANDLRESGRPFSGVSDRHYVFGLWTDSKANLYTAVFGAGKVMKISPNGKITTVFDAPMWWSPSGGLTATDGSLWILEYSRRNAARVRKINPNGREELFGD